MKLRSSNLSRGKGTENIVQGMRIASQIFKHEKPHKQIYLSKNSMLF